MCYEILLTQDEYNAVLSALHSAIRDCFECPKEEAEMMEAHKNDLLSARGVLLSAWATSEIP